MFLRAVVVVVAYAFAVGGCGGQHPTGAASKDAGTDGAAGPGTLDSGLVDASEGGAVVPAQPQMVFTAGTSLATNAGDQVFVMNLDGTDRRQITQSGNQENFLPHFSPDGTKLTYTRFMTGSYTEGAAMQSVWDSDVWTYDFATGIETNLTLSPGIEDAYPVWSPDGSRIAYVHAVSGTLPSVHVMNADGSNDRLVVQGTDAWKCCTDIAWSSNDWLISVILDDSSPACVRSRIDKFRPDGTGIVQVTQGGPNCSDVSAGYETAGDADPGFSADGQTIYSSRGFPKSPPGAPASMPPLTERKLYGFSKSDPWYAGKPESDLSLPSQPDCIEGVPRGSPDGTRVLLFRACFGCVDTGAGHLRGSGRRQHAHVRDVGLRAGLEPGHPLSERAKTTRTRYALRRWRVSRRVHIEPSSAPAPSRSATPFACCARPMADWSRCSARLT